MSFIKGLSVYNSSLCLQTLYATFKQRLQWQWLKEPAKSIAITYCPSLLLMHPYHPQHCAHVTIIGPAEYNDDKALSAFNTKTEPHLVIFTHGLCAEKYQVLFHQPNLYLLQTPEDDVTVLTVLMPYLQKHLCTLQTHHGVLLDIFGKGVLIQGPSGVGKSECAHALLLRGHRLVADDAPIFYAQANNVIGLCPARLYGLLEIRGLGIVDVACVFGECALMTEKPLSLIITLNNHIPQRTPFIELEEKIILGVPIKSLSLSLAFSKNVAILVESAVKFAFSAKSARIQRLISLQETEYEQCD